MGTQIIKYNPLPTMLKFHQSIARHRMLVGSVGCYSGDTEFLTENGWCRFDNYTNEKVAQWDATSGKISFVKPSDYIKAPCKEFIHFHNKYNLSMCLSKKHRMPLYNISGKFVVKQAYEIKKHASKYTVPTRFKVDKPDYNLSKLELRLMVGLHENGYTIIQDGKCEVVIDVIKKEKEKLRLEYLLNSLNLDFTIDYNINYPGEIHYIFVPPRLTKHYKDWGWKLSSAQLKIVVNELKYWGGKYGDNYRYYSSNKEDVDFIQYAVHATGGRAYITIDKQRHCYLVNISPEKSSKANVFIRKDNTIIKNKPSKDGFKYCFTVPTSFLVVRYEDKIFISGNSGKTSACCMEALYYLPMYLKKKYGLTKVRVLIVRNSYRELCDTTLKTIEDWFPWGVLNKTNMVMQLEHNGIELEILLRACDRPQDLKKFKSLEITIVWIDEAIELSEKIVLMLKNRVGRYPSVQKLTNILRKKRIKINVLKDFGWMIYSTNPPEVDHYMYTDFKHVVPPLNAPVPEKRPLEGHEAYFQPENENIKNLPVNYYSNLKKAYADNPDWINRYIKGLPGITLKGKNVYRNFSQKLHVAKEPLIWNNTTLYTGWDHSGNCPACIVCQIPTPGVVQVLREYFSERMNIHDFVKWVISDRNVHFPDATYVEWGDPAGFNKFSHPAGGFTSNAEIMFKLGIDIQPSEQNWVARREAVDNQLSSIFQGMPALQIDPSCKVLINGFLGGYYYSEISTSGYFRDKPNKNRFSHIQDALQYVLVKLTTNTRGKKRIPTVHGIDWEHRRKGIGV